MSAPNANSQAQFANHPRLGGVRFDPELFDHYTEEQIFSLGDRTASNFQFGGSQSQDAFPIDKRGVIAMLDFSLEATVNVTHTSGTITPRKTWPYGLLDWLEIRSGSQAVHRVRGLDLQAKRQVDFQHPAETVQSIAPTWGTTGAYNIKVFWQMPTVVDFHDLTGGLFNEAEANSFQVAPKWAAPSDVLNIGAPDTVTITNQVLKTSVHTFDVVRLPVGPNGEDVVVLPDLTVVYQNLGIDLPWTSGGEQPYVIQPLDGQLLKLYSYMQNGNVGAAQDIVDPATFLRNALRFGGNLTPRDYSPGYKLIDRNQRMYNGVIAPGYFVHDFHSINPNRDSVDPHAMATPTMVVNPGATAPNANAFMHVMQEGLSRTTSYELMGAR